MEYTTLISSTLILMGAIMMLVNIGKHRTILKAVKGFEKQSGQTKILVTAHFVFMIFFFLGYLAVLYSFIANIDLSSKLFVALIFFFGAIFVFMGILIQKRIFTSLQYSNQKLIKYNTQLKQEQNHLVEVNDQLQIEIKDKIKAQESDQMKSDFLSLVSHELRTPLTSIYGFTKLIRKDIFAIRDEKNKDALQKKRARLDGNLNIISDECNRLTRLINNVLDLARIESGQVVWEDRPVNLRELIGTAVAAVEGLFLEKKSVSFELDLDNGLPQLSVDADLFIQVLVNLINNAVKFTDQGIIKLKVWRHKDSIHIEISDEGKGIKQSDLDNIFDKFYIVRKGDTLGCKQMGTGLGLPICKQIVEHYKGRIWAESVYDKGSTFHIILPKETIC